MLGLFVNYNTKLTQVKVKCEAACRDLFTYVRNEGIIQDDLVSGTNIDPRYLLRGVIKLSEFRNVSVKFGAVVQL